jgi:adenylosuccinate synthase
MALPRSRWEIRAISSFAASKTTHAARADIVLGVQWGDEGKGRVIDAYAADYDVIARFGGGDNAGHTLVVGEQKMALRIVPSGVLRARPELFIGGGTVVSLKGLVAELDMLQAAGVDVARIKISDRAHLVLPYHPVLDRVSERARGQAAIGTTGRGIGPAYADKAARLGVTFGDLAQTDRLVDTIRATAHWHAIRFEREESAGAEAAILEALTLAPRVLPLVVDGVAYLHEKLESGKRVLIEGAQGSLLDVGFGTYPFVTSSHTIAGGACIGLGLGPTQIGRVVGVAKAYSTRVGSGPFPSELHDATAERMRERGAEFGTNTGRPRRCGWFDGVAARYAARINGLSSVVVTKLDVLSGFERLGIVTDYRLAGESAGFSAAGEPGLEPRIEWFEGWNDDLASVRRIDALPQNARRYVEALAESFGVSVEAVSVGPERAAMALA